MKRLLVVLLLALVAGCSRCGPQKPAGASAQPVERVLPAGAVGAVIVPQLASAGQKLKLIEALKVTGFAAQLQGFGDGKALADALVQEVGIDVRSPEALEKAGVDGARAAGVAALISGQVYLALPVKDPQKFHGVLEQLAHRRLGAGAGGEQKFGELTVKTFSARQGQPPKLGYALAHGYALITDGAGVGKLAGLAAMTETDSLASDRGYMAQLKQLPAERDVVVYLPTGTPALATAPFTSAAGAVSLTPAGLSVLINATWKGDPAELAMLQPQTGAQALAGYLPRDAFLVARYTGDPARLGPWVRDLLGKYLVRAFDEGGFDLKTQVLEQLKPGLVAALSLSDRPPMDKGLPAFDIRQTNPFTYAHLSAVAPTKSKDAALPALEKVAALAPRFGATMELRTRAEDGQQAMITTWAQGEGVHFAPKGELLFFASPIQRLDALVKSDGKGDSPVTPLGDDALAVAVDLTRLAASVRALPDSAWGIGGFAIKATTVRWLDATDDLKGVSLSVGAKDKVVQARLQLTLGGGAAKAP